MERSGGKREVEEEGGKFPSKVDEIRRTDLEFGFAARKIGSAKSRQVAKNIVP